MIYMYQYINEFLAECPSNMKGTAVMPVANHLFEVNENSKKLDEQEKELFHHLVAKLLDLSR